MSFLSTVLARQPAGSRVGYATFLNPYSYCVLRKNPSLLEAFDVIHSDGIALCLLLRLIGTRSERVSFDMTSLARDVFCDLNESGRSVYLVGSAPGVIERACRVIKEKYPSLNIIGTRNGFFSTRKERDQFISKLVTLQPEVLVVGMGTPLQEEFLNEVKRLGWRGEAYTCGGFLHQTARGQIDYYPRWIDRLQLRWAYRLVDEPALLRRFIAFYPRFFFLFAFDALGIFALRLKRIGGREEA